MTSRALLSALLALFFLVNQCAAESRAKGSGSINGKTVSYEFVGNQSASVQSMTNNDTTTINANIDGTAQMIKVSAAKLTWNRKDFKLGDYKQIEILMTPDQKSIKVDGKELLP